MLVSRLAVMAVGIVLILSPYSADLSAKRAYGQGSSYQNEKELANASTVTIMSSSVSSTYTRFAQDIQNVLDDKSENGLRVLPILGSGGGQNIHDMLFLKGIDMGITDTAYLSYYKRKDPALYANIENRVNYICKLLDAEMHMLTRKEIKSYADLEGKKVSFWKRNSISSLAAETVFEALGIHVQPVYLDNAAAIEKLRRGEIAAVTRTSGAPHGDYNGVKPADGFHLLGLDEKEIPWPAYSKLLERYVPARLTSAQYPVLIPEGQEVPTIATSIVLGVYNWPKNSERYYKVANFVERFFDNIDKFQEPSRHPKWAKVNLFAEVKQGWRRFPPAQEWLNRHAASAQTSAQRPSLRDEFEEFLRKYSTETGMAPQNAADRDAMFRTFTEWWQRRNAATASAGRR